MELRIKELQTKKKIKNIDLANDSGVGFQMVNYYRTGKRTPPLSTLKRIAKAMDCEVIELLPTSEKFEHIYDSKGVWKGIRKIN